MPHIHELYDFTASGYIVFDDQLLLIHHKKLGAWIAPGGHVELDENPLQTLWREIAEETGIQKRRLKLIETGLSVQGLENTKSFKSLPTPFAMFVVDYDEKSSHKHIDLCYLLLSTTSKITLEEHSSHDIGWFSAAQIDEIYKKGLMFQNSYVYSKFALEFLKNKVLASA